MRFNSAQADKLQEKRDRMTDSELERCIEKFSKCVYNAAVCCVKNRADADDITQEVFLTLFTYPGRFESDEHIKAWLLRCTVNRSRNLLRSRWYRLSQPLEDAGISVNDKYGEDCLLSLVMKLEKNSRIALYMHYYEGYSTAETAKLLGISETAVRSRLFRGRKQLKKLLGDERS